MYISVIFLIVANCLVIHSSFIIKTQLKKNTFCMSFLFNKFIEWEVNYCMYLMYIYVQVSRLNKMSIHKIFTSRMQIIGQANTSST